MLNPITAIRKERKLNRVQLSQKSGISYPTLYVIEKGMVGYMKPRTLEKLSAFAKIPISKIEENYKLWKDGLLEVAA